MMNSDEDVRGSNIQEIRFVTYLSPSIPRALYEALADHLQRTLGRERISLRVETRVSGPQRGGECSSFADEADVAFMCAPSFVWLRELRPPPVELLGVSPVFDDGETLGGPSTSATSWCATAPRSKLSPTSKEAPGPTTTR